MRLRITLDGLQTLDAVARHGSLAAAARDVHRSASTLSYTIAKLEDELGVRLFERRGPRLALTDAGRALADDARRLLEAAAAFERRAAAFGGGWEARLRVAIDASIPVALYEPELRAFDALGAPTHLRITREAFTGTWEALLAGRADLAIGVAPMSTHEGIAQRALLGDEFRFCMAPGHPLAAVAEPISDAQRRAHRAVAIADTARDAAPDLGVVDGQPVLSVPALADKIALIVGGSAVGHLATIVADRLVEHGLVVTRRVASPRPADVIALGWRADNAGPALRWWTAALAAAPAVARLREAYRALADAVPSAAVR